MKREELIVQSLEKIAKLPEGAIKKALMESLAEHLTIREVMEWIVFTTPGDNEWSEFIPILEALYVTAGVDIDTPTKNLPVILQAKMQELEPDLRQLGEIARCIVTALKEAKESA